MGYFFAYGDRMNAEKMQAGSPSARFAGPGRLDGFRLAFNVVSRSWGGGAANAVPDPRSSLWGVLWALDDVELTRLEPVNTGGADADRSFEVEVTGPDGVVKATTFWVDSPEAFVRPTDRYVDMLRATAEAHGLPQEALDELDRARAGQQGPAPAI
ncbi:MAG TPA: gamma-glutamylcyclotransferase family protein [Actinomycetota bacterium]|nr:gamma-glutamylcyclotransferase family protein [Actinomycetota bacterium]